MFRIVGDVIMLNRIKEKIKNILLTENKNEKIKEWLERNKIYFETGVATALTIMSLIVSYSANIMAKKSNELADKANEIANKSNEISEIEIEMQQKDKLPKFSIEVKINEDLSIINTGGMITDGHATLDCFLEIKAETNTGKKTNWLISVYDAYEKMNVNYNYDNNCFFIKSNISYLKKMINDVFDNVETSGVQLSYEIYELANVSYVNYFDDSCDKYYYIKDFIGTYNLENINSDKYYDFFEKQTDFIFCNSSFWKDETINESKEKLKNGIQNMINELSNC